MRPATTKLTQHEYGYLNALLTEKMVEASKHTPPSEDPSHLFRVSLQRRLGALLFEGEIVLLPYSYWDRICTEISAISEDLDELNAMVE